MMDICSQEQGNEYAWQASEIGLINHFKDKLTLVANGTKYYEIQTARELTTGAVFMIIVMAIFCAFAMLGSLCTVYEYLHEKNTKKLKIKGKDIKIFTNNMKLNIKKISDSEEDNKDTTNDLQLNGKKENINFKESKKFLSCFCFLRNGKKMLFQTVTAKDDFQCFHGIRFFSNISIILFHVAFFYILTRRNMDNFTDSVHYLIFQCGFSFILSVNTFFILSSFLNAFSFFKEYNKNNGKIHWCYFYLKRFVRLTPVYMIVLGFHTFLFCYTGSGPIWPEYVTNPICQEKWWWNLFYINNFQASIKMCMMCCWHLAAEMQLYAISPIYMLTLLKWPSFGFGLASFSIFLSCASRFILTKQLNIIFNFWKVNLFFDNQGPFVDNIILYFDKLHSMPYTNINSYLVGILLGYYFFKRRSNFTRLGRITLTCGWIATFILMWISIFVLFKREESFLESAVYSSVKDLFFSLGISWIIFVCLNKPRGLINTFLSWKVFFPFSKLSYCAYLIHILILKHDLNSARDVEEFAFSSLILYGLRVYFWTVIISIPVSLLFEMPIINLFDLFMKKRIQLLSTSESTKSSKNIYS